MEHSFEINKLYETYQGLVTENYKSALSDLMEANIEYKPPVLNVTEASVMDAAEHIQNCSVYYATVSKLASFARSAHTLAEGLYKQKFRSALVDASGSNAAQREAVAASQTTEEYNQVLFYQSAAILFDSLEKAGRSAADSSRKMAELIQSQRITEAGNKY